MKNYELTVMFHPDLEMNIAPAVKKVDDLITELGGKIINKTEEGKKHLAYSVKKQDYAVFYFYEVNLPPTAPAKISSVFSISDEVIRYLLVTADPKRRKAAEHADKAKDDQEESDEKEEK